MSMIKCPECGKEISELASKCPNCGFPIGFNSGNTTSSNTNNMEPSISTNSYTNQQSTSHAPQIKAYTQKKTHSALGIVALVLSVLGCTFVFGLILAIIDLCKKNDNKKTCSVIALVICGFWLVIGMVGAASSTSSEESSRESVSTESNQVSNTETERTVNKNDIKDSSAEANTSEPDTKDKYYVGDTWQNKYIKVIYSNCYEFTEYNQFNEPADGYKIICAEFEFENIGDSDSTVMYTDFHGYADGYEANQSYAPNGTGLDFTVKMSAGRKGTGKVAFEVPKDAQEIEIEFSPNMWTSENVIFVYQ